MSTLFLGANGFLGRNIVPALEKVCKNPVIIEKSECDLQNPTEVERLFLNVRPDTVVNFSGKVGGFLANKEKPADLGLINLQIGTNICLAALKTETRRILNFLGSCSYPTHITTGIKETDLAMGLPDKTSAPYALGKTAVHFNLMAMNAQYGMENLTIVPANVYGPFDHFDPKEGHVVPALICKIEEAKKNKKTEIKMVGSGRAKRDFLYVPDLIQPLEYILKENDPSLSMENIINIGTGSPTSIHDLASIIAKTIGFDGELIWEESSVNDGQNVKFLNCDKLLSSQVPFKSTMLEKGIKFTYEHYKKSFLGQND